MQTDILFEMDPMFAAQPEILLVGGPFPEGWTSGMEARDLPIEEAVQSVRSGRPMVVIAALSSLDGPLGAALATPGLPSFGLVLVPDRSDHADDNVDFTGPLLELPDLLFLSPDTPDAQAHALVAELAARQSLVAGVADGGMELGAGFRLDALRQDAERVARALAELVAGQPDASDAARPVTAARIRAHLRARRARAQFFGPDLFADPAWDMLLDLAAARQEGCRVSVSSLCIAAAVPTTTALRWIKTLVDQGLLAREADPEDGRRAFISLSAPAAGAMEHCLAHVLNYPGQ